MLDRYSENTAPNESAVDGDDAARRAEQIDFIIEMGCALQQYGEPAHTLEDTLKAIADRLGLPASFFITPTSLMASFGTYENQQTRMVRIEGQRIDLGKLRRINEVTALVSDGKISVRQGVRFIRELVASPGLYSGSTVTIFVAAAEAAAVAPMLGGGWMDALWATVLGAIVGILLTSIGRSHRTMLLLSFVAAMAMTFLAILVSIYEPTISPFIVTLSSLIALLPGLSLTTAILELSTRNLSSGTARLTGALLVLLQLAAGVAFGSLLGAAVFGVPAPIEAVTSTPPELLSLAIGLFAVALFIDFRADPSDFYWIVLFGVATWLVYYVTFPALGSEPAVFIGALAAGLLAEMYVVLTGRPISVVLVPSITFLVPGAVGFRSVTSLLSEDIERGVETAFAMSLTGVSLAAGVLASAAAFESWRRIAHRDGESSPIQAPHEPVVRTTPWLEDTDAKR